MGNINRVDIYVGAVGTAYVDKETARKNLEAALQNIEDMYQIIADAEQASRNVEVAKNAAENAYEGAANILSQLNAEMSVYEEGANHPKYNLLRELYNELLTNDNDGINSNGGNIVTATDNINELAKQFEKIEKVLEEANGYVSEEEPVGRLISIRDEYQAAYEAALELFESMIPEEIFTPNEESDRIEKDLIKRINAVNAAVDSANETTAAINTTTSEITTRMEEILNDEEPTPINKFTVTLEINNGFSSTSLMQTINEGSYAEWQVQADEGYELPETVTNGTISGNVVRSVEVHSELTVVVDCVEQTTIYTVRLIVENGTTEDATKLVNAGESVSWTITPAEGYKLPEEKEEFEIDTENNIVTTTPDSDKIYTITCVPVEAQPTQYEVTLDIQNGTTSDEVVQMINEGEIATWEVVPNEGYELPETVINGTINGNVITSNPAYTNTTVIAICRSTIPVNIPENLWYIGTTLPTSENIEEIGTEINESVPSPSFEYSYQEYPEENVEKYIYFAYPKTLVPENKNIFITQTDPTLGEPDGAGFNSYNDWYSDPITSVYDIYITDIKLRREGQDPLTLYLTFK